jgi:hypothetical protein
MIMEKGWMYDSQRGCWLSPGETYSEPDKQAVVADSFDLVADPPKAGWWDIGFVINGKEYWIASSEVYDPLLDYHNLMLAVVHGRNIRITINEERCYTDISIYCKADGIIRLILKLFGTKEPTEVDVLIDGREFVQKLYILLCGFFGNRKELEKEWLMESEDLYDTKNDEAFVEYIERIKKERGYPSYPVEEIEKYLATPLTG